MNEKHKAPRTLFRVIVVNVAVFALCAILCVFLLSVLTFNRFVRDDVFSCYVGGKSLTLDVFIDQNFRNIETIAGYYSDAYHDGTLNTEAGRRSFLDRIDVYSLLNQSPLLVIFDDPARKQSLLSFGSNILPVSIDIGHIYDPELAGKSRIAVTGDINLINGWQGIWIFMEIVENRRRIGYVASGINAGRIDGILKTGLSTKYFLRNIESYVSYWLTDSKGSVIYTTFPDAGPEFRSTITNGLSVENGSLLQTDRVNGTGTDPSGQKVVFCPWMLRSGSLAGDGLFLVGALPVVKLERYVVWQAGIFILVLAIIFVLFGHVIIELYKRHVSGPMESVRKIAANFAAQNYEVPVPSDLKWELGELFSALESIRVNIRDYNLHLEQVLKSRNEELQYALSRLKTREESLKQDLSFASSIQQGILPGPTEWLDLELNPFVRELEEVGGDLVDIIAEDNRLAAYVADISGHGVPASLISMLTKIIFIYAIQNGDRAEDIIREVNEQMNSYVARQSIKYINYFTVFFVYFHPDYRFEYLSAGHVPAIIYRRKNDICDLLTTSSSMIGVFGSEIVRFSASSDSLDPGDKLLIFTDGFINAKSSNGRKYGADRAMKCLAKNSRLSGRDLQEVIWDDFLRFTNNLPLTDDTSFLLIERKD